jgi:uracil-DNA glycosylase
LTLLIGQYAQHHFLASRRKPSLAESTRAWREYAPQHIPLRHPSPRNQPWFKRHAWFEEQLIPMLQSRIKTILAAEVCVRQALPISRTAAAHWVPP